MFGEDWLVLLPYFSETVRILISPCRRSGSTT